MVVHAPRLEAAAILTSLEAGDFYASTGVELAAYSADRTAIAVTVKPNGDTRYRIRLISGGATVETIDGPAARFALSSRRGYARVVVTDSNGATAWGQPVFLD